jgi:hypothetical protein
MSGRARRSRSGAGRARLDGWVRFAGRRGDRNGASSGGTTSFGLAPLKPGAQLIPIDWA